MFAFIHSCLSAPANHDSRLIPYSRVCLDFQFIRLTPLRSRGSLCQKRPPRRNPTSAGWRAELASSVYANTCVSSLPSNWGEVANDLPCSSVQKINSNHTDTKETTFFLLGYRFKIQVWQARWILRGWEMNTNQAAQLQKTSNFPGHFCNCYITGFLQQLSEARSGGNRTLTWQMRKPRPREVEWFAWGHSARQKLGILSSATCNCCCWIFS